MGDWRGGEAKYGDISPGTAWPKLDARRLGLAPGWREELRRGEPTWPNAEILSALMLSSSRLCRAKSAP